MADRKAEHKMIGIVTVEWLLFAIIVTGIPVSHHQDIQKALKDPSPDTLKRLKITLGVFVGCLVYVVSVNIMLTFGVYKRLSLSCKIWYVLIITSVALQGIALGFSVRSLFVSYVNIISMIIYVIFLTYRYNCYKIMSEFLDDLKENQGGTCADEEQNRKKFEDVQTSRI